MPRPDWEKITKKEAWEEVQEIHKAMEQHNTSEKLSGQKRGTEELQEDMEVNEPI